MHDLTKYFVQCFPSMIPHKSIDTVLLSVAADKLFQREWNWIKLNEAHESTTSNDHQRHIGAPPRYFSSFPTAGNRELSTP
jgi:hypothetical protein